MNRTRVSVTEMLLRGVFVAKTNTASISGFNCVQEYTQFIIIWQ